MAKAGELAQTWLELLIAERQRRYSSSDDCRAWLLAELEMMAERARAAPGWRPPTAEERRRGLAEIESWLRERGYMQS